MPAESAISHVSDTARWVALYRAMESERQDALFHDPYARGLAGERGVEILRTMPKGRAWAWPMIVRTAVMNDRILGLARDGGIDVVTWC
ncbi:MAG TPA: class I SAM-dependent methyltransferase [Gemmatimonadales bacterium]|nr:class I SAM-dependent methyltransferase [Gemmatimonadales bacterium]